MQKCSDYMNILKDLQKCVCELKFYCDYWEYSNILWNMLSTLICVTVVINSIFLSLQQFAIVNCKSITVGGSVTHCRVQKLLLPAFLVPLIIV